MVPPLKILQKSYNSNGKRLSGTQSHYLLLAIASSRFEGYLGKEPSKSVCCPCHRMRKRVLRWKVPASTFAASLGNALPRMWPLTVRTQAGLRGPNGDCFILAF